MKKAKPKNALRRFREGKGWTQTQLAAVLGISRPTCYRMESKPRVTPIIEFAIVGLEDKFGK